MREAVETLLSSRSGKPDLRRGGSGSYGAWNAATRDIDTYAESRVRLADIPAVEHSSTAFRQVVRDLTEYALKALKKDRESAALYDNRVEDDTHDTPYAYYRQITACRPLSKLEERQVLAALKDGNPREQEKARELLIKHNLRGVVRLARVLQRGNRGYSVSDAVQQGNLGLLCAMKRFDPSRNMRFFTYAAWWVGAKIREYILRNVSLVKFGTTQKQRRVFGKIGEARRFLAEFTDNNEHNLSPAERYKIMADFIGDVSPEDVRVTMARLQTETLYVVSREQADEDSAHKTYVKDIPDTDDSPLDKAAFESVFEYRNGVAERLVRALPERHRDIITRRFLNEPVETLRQIGESYGVSRERIRQVEQQALVRLRKIAEARGIKADNLWVH